MLIQNLSFSMCNKLIIFQHITPSLSRFLKINPYYLVRLLKVPSAEFVISQFSKKEFNVESPRILLQ